jgi:hypothetical protein
MSGLGAPKGYEDDDDEVFIDIKGDAAAAARPLLHQTSTGSGASNTLNNQVRNPVSSKPGSRAASPMGSTSFEDDVPTNVNTIEQLKDLPEECLSGDPIRPLQHFDEDGKVNHYALQPMVYSVFMILLMEGVERFAFYGLEYTQTSYLTGSYNSKWNAGMDAIPASSVRLIHFPFTYLYFAFVVSPNALLDRHRSTFQFPLQ